MRLILRAIVLCVLTAFPALAQVPSPQIPLTGTPGAGGNFPFLPNGSFAMPSDANYTVIYPNTSCVVCVVTSSVSLTSTRNLIEPAQKLTFNVTNLTSGGQSIQVIASTGTGVTVANGTSKWVYFNGTNYVEIDPPSSGGGVSSLNSLTGAVNITAGSGVTVTPSGSSIAIAATGGATVNSSPTVYSANGQVLADSTTYATTNGLLTFGDSLTACQGATTTANCWVNEVASDYNMNTNFTNYGTGGDRGPDLAGKVLTYTNPGDTGNPIYTDTIGSSEAVAGTGSIGAGELLVYTRAYYAGATWLALSSTDRTFMNNANVTCTGTWTADTSFANAPGKDTSAAGNCTMASAPVGPSGVFYVRARSNGTDGNFHVTIDGTTATDTICNCTSVTGNWTGDTPNSVTVSQALARYVTTPGIHSIAVVWESGTIGVFSFEFPPNSRYRGNAAPRAILGSVQPTYGGTHTTPLAQIFGIQVATAIQLSLTDKLNTPLVDLTGMDPNNYNSVANGNCVASAASPLHGNNCNNRQIAGLMEATIGGTAANSNFTLAAPVQVHATAAATSGQASSNWFEPHQYNDPLIAPMIWGTGNGGGGSSFAPIGCKQSNDATLGFGHLCFTDQPTHYTGWGYVDTTNPTAESNFHPVYYGQENGSSQFVWHSPCFQSTTDTTPVCALDNFILTTPDYVTCSGACALNTLATYYRVQVTGNITVSFNGLYTIDGSTAAVEFCQDGTGGHTISPSGSIINWPANLLAANTAPGACVMLVAAADHNTATVDFSGPYVVSTAAIAGGATGSAPYQSTSSATSFIASPTTSGHTYFYGWQPSGSAVAPQAFDFVSTAASLTFTTLTSSGINKSAGYSFGTNVCGFTTVGITCSYDIYNDGTTRVGTSAGPGNTYWGFTSNASSSVYLGTCNFAGTSCSPWFTASATGAEIPGLGVSSSPLCTTTGGALTTTGCLPLRTTVSVGAITEGTCTQTTVTLTGLTSTMTISASAQANPGSTSGVVISTYYAAANTAGITACAMLGNSTTTTFNVSAQ